MSKTTKTTKTTLNYIPKLIINGTEIKQHAKQVVCNINNNEVALTCCYINEIELKEAYISSFTVKTQEKNINVVYAKVSNRVSATIYINNTLAFSSLSIQGVFTTLNAAYGLSKSSLNNLYVKSNSMRKQSNTSVSKVVVDSSFNF